MSQDNVIDRLPRDFGEVGEELHLLAMRGNLLSSLPKCLGGCAGLKVIDVSRNKISKIETPISLPNLADLNLSHNMLTELPDCWGGLRSLAKLDLSHNRLTSLPPSIGKMAGLQIFIVEKNELSSLPNLGGSKKLTTLQLAKNALSDCPALTTCANLETLDLTQNGLSALPKLPSSGIVKLLVSSNALPQLNGPVLFGMVSNKSPLRVRRKKREKERDISNELMPSTKSIEILVLLGIKICKQYL